jgi:hypothetical protein
MQRTELIARIPKGTYILPMKDFLALVEENEAHLRPVIEHVHHHRLLPEHIEKWLTGISKNAVAFQSDFPPHWPSLKALAREYATQLQCVQWATLLAAFRAFVPRIQELIKRAQSDMNVIVVFLVPMFLLEKSNFLFTMILCSLMKNEDLFPDFVVRSLNDVHSLC